MNGPLEKFLNLYRLCLSHRAGEGGERASREGAWGAHPEGQPTHGEGQGGSRRRLRSRGEVRGTSTWRSTSRWVGFSHSLTFHLQMALDTVLLWQSFHYAMCYSTLLCHSDKPFIYDVLLTTLTSSCSICRWDQDIVFRHQSRDEPEVQQRFINDPTRNDFHLRFMNKYIQWLF